MTSLEGWGSTIELRPRAAPARPSEGAAQHAITGSVPAHLVKPVHWIGPGRAIRAAVFDRVTPSTRT